MDDHLRKREDLAFHSRFEWRVDDRQGHTYHLPLVDLGGHWSDIAAKRLSDSLAAAGCKEAAFYRSGRSFHLYGFHLLTGHQWLRFMARLLQANRGIDVDEHFDSTRIGSILEPLFDDQATPSDAVVARDGLTRLCGNRASASEATNTAIAELREAADVPRITRAACLLLLANPKNDKQVVDSRWVAHRLIAGYAALRWTSHQNQYLSVPALVGRFETDKPIKGKHIQAELAL